MSRKIENQKKYEEELKEYAEKANFSSNFETCVTMTAEEHKMLIDSYKKGKFQKDKDYQLFERADLEDYFKMERKRGGTSF